MAEIIDDARAAVDALRENRTADALSALARASVAFRAHDEVRPMHALLLGQAQLAHERFPAAVHTLDRGLESEPLPPVAAALRATRAAALTPMMRFEQADRDLALAAEVWDELGAREHLFVSRVQQAVAADLRGDDETCKEAIQRGRALLDHLPDSPVKAARVCRLAALGERDPGERIAEILAAGGPELETLEATTAVQLMGVLVRCHQEAGRRAEAERWAARMSRRAAVTGLPLGRARVRVARATLLMGIGDIEGASDLALRGAEAAQRLSALADALEARVLASSGLDDREAERQLTEVVEIATDHRAERMRRHAVKLLRDRGVTIYDGPIDPAKRMQRLTDAELRVMQLVVGGHCDADVAAQLSLTDGAVERHVSAVLNKLGARSRAELSGFAARLQAAATS